MEGRSGSTVRALREMLGLGQDELAQRAKVAKSTIQRIEADYPFRPEIRHRLADALGIPVEYLMAGPERALDAWFTTDRMQRLERLEQAEHDNTPAPKAKRGSSLQQRPGQETLRIDGPAEPDAPAAPGNAPSAPPGAPASKDGIPELMESLPQDCAANSIEMAVYGIKSWLTTNEFDRDDNGHKSISKARFAELMEIWVAQAAGPDAYDETLAAVQAAAGLPAGSD